MRRFFVDRLKGVGWAGDVGSDGLAAGIFLHMSLNYIKVIYGKDSFKIIIRYHVSSILRADFAVDVLLEVEDLALVFKHLYYVSLLAKVGTPACSASGDELSCTARLLESVDLFAKRGDLLSLLVQDFS